MYSYPPIARSTQDLLAALEGGLVVCHRFANGDVKLTIRRSDIQKLEVSAYSFLEWSAQIRLASSAMSIPTLFKWRHYLPEIILLSVRWYCRHPLIYRNLEEMMAERGVDVSHVTATRLRSKTEYIFSWESLVISYEG